MRFCFTFSIDVALGLLGLSWRWAEPSIESLSDSTWQTLQTSRSLNLLADPKDPAVSDIHENSRNKAKKWGQL